MNTREFPALTVLSQSCIPQQKGVIVSVAMDQVVPV